MGKIIYNDSEAQLFEFIISNKNVQLSLHPQGDNTIIQKEAVNLCIVKVEDRTYTFGGIREHIYDKLVTLK